MFKILPSLTCHWRAIIAGIPTELDPSVKYGMSEARQESLAKMTSCKELRQGYWR